MGLAHRDIETVIETSPQLIESLHTARTSADSGNFIEVHPGHLLLAMLSDEEASFLLEAYGVDFDKARLAVQKQLDRLPHRLDPDEITVFSRAIELIMEHARHQARKNGLAEVDSNLVFAVLLSDEKSDTAKLMAPYDLDLDGVLQYLELREGKAIQIDPLPSLPAPRTPRPAPPKQAAAAVREAAAKRAPEQPAARKPGSQTAPRVPKPPASPAAGLDGAAERPEAAAATPLPSPSPTAKAESPEPTAPAAEEPEEFSLADFDDDFKEHDERQQPDANGHAVTAESAGPQEETPAQDAAPHDEPGAAAAAPPPPPQPQSRPQPGATPAGRPAGAPAPIARPAVVPASPLQPPRPASAAPRGPLAPADLPPHPAAMPSPPPNPARTPPAAPPTSIVDQIIARSIAADIRRGAGETPPVAPAVPPRATRRRQSGTRSANALTATGSVLEKGRLVENVPRRMRVDRPSEAEVRITRAQMNEIASEFASQSGSHMHDLTVTEAMTVQLRSPGGNFHIENLSPQTQWIDRHQRHVDDADFGVWRWNVTPRKAGRARLQLVVSARTVDEDGAIHIADVPDKIIDIAVQADRLRGVRRAGTLLLIGGGGIAVGHFAEKALKLLAGLPSLLH